ncbi:hypothetical protein JOQ06_018655 [Pogonophryne albipinna]|uniref:Uncharacterized protein n=1 Tax=Pogonophryne albipinna TaxID=1090488 RepID=A0AAD6AS44_9TELE|nr:hypothetical protein JOQ06_018655 [Pogonophryne albipinna]
METVQQAKKNFSALRAEGREIEYPAKCLSVNAKDKHKEKTLCGNPEVLFTDYAQQKEGRKKNNLIFFTDSIYIWKDTLCSNYAYVSREGIGSGGRLKICKDEHLDKDDPLLTITYYTKGKVMVQGNEANLGSFQEAFPLLKAEVDTKRINVPSDVPSDVPSGVPSGVPSDSEAETVLGLDSVSRYPTSGVGELEARTSSLGWSACRRKCALHRGKSPISLGP